MNKFPDIDVVNDFNNPILVSPNSYTVLPFYQTRETLFDTESYNAFLVNAIKRFRNSKTYKHYKGFLINLGLDRCQFHGNITNEMATIEMHHNIINIHDIAYIITEHILNTVGKITTFDLVELLKQEHKNNNIPLVMLSLTPHQLYHNTDQFFIHPSMCFGNWTEFLKKYNKGIGIDIANKLIYYLENVINSDGSDDYGLLDLEDNIRSWAYNNERL